MSYFEAAIEILEQASKPLTTREVTDAAMKAGLLKPKGKTPEATMSAALYTRAGADTRLVKLATPGAKRAHRGSVRWSVRKAR
jgi:HB1, ASXL, restriction endonuclease HTH domain